MARPASRPLVGPFPWRPLARRLDARQRARVAACLRAMLAWQRSLESWPAPSRGLPDATPFVSLYAGGALVGCYGSDEGAPGERLARAFLRALHDARFGGIPDGRRLDLAAQVSYPIRPRVLSPDRVLSHVEVGTHGIGIEGQGGVPVILLPHVARDAGATGAELLQLASRKAGIGLDAWRSRKVALFETEDVVARQDASDEGPSRRFDARDAGAAWLAGLVGAEGAVCFAIDGRTGVRHSMGPMLHGRSAWVVRALRAHAARRPELRRIVERATARLARDVRAAVSGRRVAGWPEDPAMAAGTCALAVLAGAPVERELALLARDAARLARNPWHAAQVALALGDAADPALWRACVADLERNPWAPWTSMAARARDDGAVVARTERAVIASLRRSPPHAGGADVTGVPELALTALAIESLASAQGAAARRARRDGREFLLRWQLRAPSAALAIDQVHGAFPVSPVVSLARADVTAHALLALSAAEGDS